jgi:2-C-methyl-D-erythritol 4-phosphate cytidylyltransferase
MGAGQPKLMRTVEGRPVILRTLDAIAEICRERYVGLDYRIIIVTTEDLLGILKAMCAEYFADIKIIFTLGGNTRTESVSLGLNMINDAEDDDLVLVHDGARCLVTSEEIKACIDGLKDHSVCASAVPVKNTLKEVDKLSSGEIKVTSTPDRSRFYEILTPQGFKFKDIETCYIKAIDQGITATDDTALAEMCGIDVYLTKGFYSNLKITTPEDIAFASEIIRNRGDSEPFHD